MGMNLFEEIVAPVTICGVTGIGGAEGVEPVKESGKVGRGHGFMLVGGRLNNLPENELRRSVLDAI
jgi:hypothetical protein